MTENTTQRLDDLLQPGMTLMVGTTAPHLDSRPLTVARVDGGRIHILVDAREDWAASFNAGDAVHATLSDNRSNSWAAITGTGTLSRDPGLIEDLWNPLASAFFDDGKDTPGIAAFTIDVDRGRYWSTPSGRLGSLISIVRAAVGAADDSGEYGEISTSG